MITTYRAFTAPDDPAAATGVPSGVTSMFPPQPYQEELDLTGQQKRHWARHQKEYLAGHQKQTLAGCRTDIVSLIQAMYKCFGAKDLWSTTTLKELGYKTFGDLALAFGLPWIYEEILATELKVSKLSWCCSNTAGVSPVSHLLSYLSSAQATCTFQ